MINKKHIVLCADDYGLNEAVTQGILTLVAQNRLSAVSVMTTFASLKQDAFRLLAIHPKAAIGLHLNLTDGDWLTRPHHKAPKLWQLILKTHLKKLDMPALIKEIQAQIERFEQAFGKRPDFIDGHQHVHQLPQIRDALLSVYHEHYPEKTAFIRATYPIKTSSAYRKKAALLTRLGGARLTKMLKAQHIPHHDYFSGVYDFSPHLDYGAYFKKMLHQCGDNTLIMCHPGLQSNDKHDAIYQSRYNEWQYFQSAGFLQDLEEAHVTLK